MKKIVFVAMEAEEEAFQKEYLATKLRKEKGSNGWCCPFELGFLESEKAIQIKEDVEQRET